MGNFKLDDNVYFLLLLGMVAVGAHAYSLFNQPIDRPSAATRWRFLSSIPIELATTQPRFRLGLVFYVVVFELIYLVLSSSSSLLLMTYQMSGRQDLTGALSESVAPSGTVPILASTAIILFTQIRPVSHAELILRRFSHRMARVPDGLKMVKQRASEYLRHADLPETVFSTELARIDGRADPLISDRLKHSQMIIGWLFENTLGARGSMAWDEEGSEEITLLFKPLKFEVMQLRGDILETSRPAESDGRHNDKSMPLNMQAQGPWQELLNRSLYLEERLTLLLCLLIINQPEIDTKDQDELAQIIERTRRREHSEVSEITVKSCALGVLISVLALFIVETSWNQLESDLNVSPYTAKAPYGDYLEARVNSNSENSTLYSFDGLSPSERQGLTLENSIQRKLLFAFEETLWTGITFMCAVFIALSMNTPHIQMWKSEDLSDRSEPVTPSLHYTLIAMSALAAVASTLFVYMFITKALLPALQKNIDVLSFQIMAPFASMFPTILRYALAAAACAVFVVWFDGNCAVKQQSLNRKKDELECNTRAPLLENIFARTMAAPSRVMASNWLACASAAAFISLIFLTTSIAVEPDIGMLEAASRILTAFTTFLCFLLVLAMVIPWHSQRYSAAPVVRSEINDREFLKKNTKINKRARRETDKATEVET